MMDEQSEWSPLDPTMWSPVRITESWLRVDSMDLKDLLQLPNIREWLGSSLSRAAAFEELLHAAKLDLSRWSARSLGLIPSGVGGLTIAVEVNRNFAVGKWIAERDEHDQRVAMSYLLFEAGLGPEVLDVSETGLLIRKVEPGTPLRSMGPSMVRLQRVAELLPRMRTIPVPEAFGFAATTEMLLTPTPSGNAEMDDRVQHISHSALQVVERMPLFLGHGDFQMGNVLQGSEDTLAVIDATGIRDAGYIDAARLLVHSACDALGFGLGWDLEVLTCDVATWCGLHSGPLAMVSRAVAIRTASDLQQGVKRRAWEFDALEQVVERLGDGCD